MNERWIAKCTNYLLVAKHVNQGSALEYFLYWCLVIGVDVAELTGSGKRAQFQMIDLFFQLPLDRSFKWFYW